MGLVVLRAPRAAAVPMTFLSGSEFCQRWAMILGGFAGF